MLTTMDRPAIDGHIPVSRCLELSIRTAKAMVRNSKDGTWLRLIPEGEFLAGGKRVDEGGGPFPVPLPAYYLALHCVTKAQYARFLNETRPQRSDLDKWVSGFSNFHQILQAGHQYLPKEGEEEHPVVDVSFLGAWAYCGWSGLRLPSELEWEKGARGLDGRNYPWGKDWDEKKCRNKNNRGKESTCAVWGYPEGNSPYGHYQMSGNVWEWCGDRYDSNAYTRYKAGDLKAPASGEYRVLRGGSWVNDNLDYFRCANRHYEPFAYNSYVGFRCARTI